jgi:hypothetical protein
MWNMAKCDSLFGESSVSHVPLGRHDEAVVVLRGDMLWFEDMSTQSPSARRLFEKVEELFK